MDSQPPARNSEGARCGCKACKLQRVGWGSGYVQHLVLWKVYINCHGLHFVCCVVLLWCANFNDVPAVQLKPLPGQSINVHYQLLLCRKKKNKNILSLYNTTPQVYRNSLPQKFRGWTLSFNIFPSMMAAQLEAR